MKLLLTLAALLIALTLSAQTPTDSATLYYQRAYIIEMGNDTVPGDIYAAIPLYRRAADLGMPAAQSYLGFCYYNGLGIQRDTEKASDGYSKPPVKATSKQPTTSASYSHKATLRYATTPKQPHGLPKHQTPDSPSHMPNLPTFIDKDSESNATPSWHATSIAKP